MRAGKMGSFLSWAVSTKILRGPLGQSTANRSVGGKKTGADKQTGLWEPGAGDVTFVITGGEGETTVVAPLETNSPGGTLSLNTPLVQVLFTTLIGRWRRLCFNWRTTNLYSLWKVIGPVWVNSWQEAVLVFVVSSDVITQLSCSPHIHTDMCSCQREQQLDCRWGQQEKRTLTFLSNCSGVGQEWDAAEGKTKVTWKNDTGGWHLERHLTRVTAWTIHEKH